MVVRGTSRELVEDMVGSLRRLDGYNTRSLQEICGYGCPRYAACPVKADVCELAEAGGVVIADGLGIAKGLQQWIGL